MKYKIDIVRQKQDEKDARYPINEDVFELITQLSDQQLLNLIRAIVEVSFPKEFKININSEMLPTEFKD